MCQCTFLHLFVHLFHQQIFTESSQCSRQEVGNTVWWEMETALQWWNLQYKGRDRLSKKQWKCDECPQGCGAGGSSGENLEAPSWGFFAVIKRVLKSVMSGMSLEGWARWEGWRPRSSLFPALLLCSAVQRNLAFASPASARDLHRARARAPVSFCYWKWPVAPSPPPSAFSNFKAVAPLIEISIWEQA